MKSLAKQSLLWVTLAILLLMLFSAARFGIAELLSISANRSLDELRSAGPPIAVVQIESVARRFEFARFLSESDPAHHDDIAQFNLWRAKLPDVTPVEKQALLLAGLAEARIVIGLDPSSPYNWGSLLMFKRELGEYDAEFIHALHRAVELGPWEPDLIILLADVGLSAWTALPPTEQSLIQQVFVRGMKNQSERILDVVRSYRSKCDPLAAVDMQKAGCQ